MAIPQNFFQTFKTSKLPLLTRYYIRRFQKKNPGWNYEFYDDQRITDFFKNEMPPEHFDAYHQLTIGAAKADYFRYAVLYKYGGVYLDIDGYVKTPLHKFILDNDEAIISPEGNPGIYCQWALIFNKEHPFLNKVLQKVLENIQQNKFPNDVHKTTGPTVYTEGINEVLLTHPNTSYRMAGVDFEGHLISKYPLSKLMLYGKRSEHWKKQQETQPLLKHP